MKKPERLLRYARETVERTTGTRFPGAPDVQPLSAHYVDLRVSDSEGRIHRASDLVTKGPRLVLVGDPGSGKTTALRYFAARLSSEFVDGENDVLPVYLPLRNMALRKEEPILTATGLAPQDLHAKQILLLLDGLDEVAATDRATALSLIADFGSRYPKARIVLASRPAGLSPPPPDEYRFYHLGSLDLAQAREIVARLTDDPSQRDSFYAILDSASFLQGLSQSPLLIHLLWEVYRHEARLPTIRADLYQTACDFLLSRWDAARGIVRDQSRLNIEAVHQILEAIAFASFTASRHLIPIPDVRAALVDYIDSRRIAVDGIDATLEHLLSSGILVRQDVSSVSFAHLTFMEFYAARYLIRSPRKLASLLADAGTLARETLLFAAGMLLDVAPLVETAVDRRELILAANCLREGRTENRALEAYVLDQLQRELGPDLIRKLAGGITEQKRPQPESIHSVLKRLYTDAVDSDIPGHTKGERFERFAERFFQQTFTVVKVDQHTENGEVDLILENTGRDPFWTEYGGDVFVECKNWDSSRPLKETAAFSQKVKLARGKLGFFVSVAGFTKDALRTLKNQVADRDAPLIVPIAGEDIVRMLDHRERFELFFKEAIRRIRHLHKW